MVIRMKWLQLEPANFIMAMIFSFLSWIYHYEHRPILSSEMKHIIFFFLRLMIAGMWRLSQVSFIISNASSVCISRSEYMTAFCLIARNLLSRSSNKFLRRARIFSFVFRFSIYAKLHLVAFVAQRASPKYSQSFQAAFSISTIDPMKW